MKVESEEVMSKQEARGVFGRLGKQEGHTDGAADGAADGGRPSDRWIPCFFFLK